MTISINFQLSIMVKLYCSSVLMVLCHCSAAEWSEAPPTPTGAVSTEESNPHTETDSEAERKALNDDGKSVDSLRMSICYFLRVHASLYITVDRASQLCRVESCHCFS